MFDISLTYINKNWCVASPGRVIHIDNDIKIILVIFLLAENLLT